MAILSPRVMNFAYGFGAAVVIVGALFKLMHWPGASAMLIAGLGTEALIFGLSAFETPAQELDWTLVYPELAGGQPTAKKARKEEPVEAQGILSQKLDAMLKEAKIDGELMASLGNSIKNFEGAAKNMAPTVDAIAGQKKYADEMLAAANNMASLNNLYKSQLESASRNAEANQEIAENAAKLKEQMQSMTTNIATLNSVYGGMLSAMSNRG
ncbi:MULTISPECIES: type IX secretion system motor protein PorL/GldL [Flavobacterium]|uniref:Gliding motility protein GldL n=2 Tax=Flavobacterium TaxID=237 RepID=A0AA94F082_9FLAO|nr:MULTISPECIES: gliding motility protein GldL [Flavobacterium]OXA83602.1 gliding motility protein GldL [Flavobacterium columnare NBRC 100251 = ATCC 23463]AMA50007.1 gliding motility protein GldL [Flavobacterium covae]AND64463.1 gliding motility protein GldL [Flavobacterium covae]MCH4829200.1 gliding motility protein GldL [Flavobacterium columnare]MCH4833977.1 gliding motility protein GldL [Flavobacterium columnare]